MSSSTMCQQSQVCGTAGFKFDDSHKDPCKHKPDLHLVQATFGLTRAPRICNTTSKRNAATHPHSCTWLPNRCQVSARYRFVWQSWCRSTPLEGKVQPCYVRRQGEYQNVAWCAQLSLAMVPFSSSGRNQRKSNINHFRHRPFKGPIKATV